MLWQPPVISLPASSSLPSLQNSCVGNLFFFPEPFIFRFAFILLAYLCDPFYFSFRMKIFLLFSFHFQGTGHLSQSMQVYKYCHTAVTLTCVAEGFLTQNNGTGADWDHPCQLLPHQWDSGFNCWPVDKVSGRRTRAVMNTNTGQFPVNASILAHPFQ